MRRTLKTLVATSALVAGIAIAPALYAQSTEATPGTQVPAIGQDNMPCQGNLTGQAGTMGQGNMAGHGGATGQYGMGQGQGQGGMIGRGGMGQGQGGAMGQGNMMGMMTQMGQMMEAHGKAMQSLMKEHGVAPSATE